MLTNGRFDLVILDIQMPQVNGFELCQQLRRMPRYTSVPVIFLSTGVDLQDRAGVVAAGGNDLVSKPVSPLELILKVTMQLLKSSSHNESAMKMANFEPTRGLSIRLTGSREPGAGLCGHHPAQTQDWTSDGARAGNGAQCLAGNPVGSSRSGSAGRG